MKTILITVIALILINLPSKIFAQEDDLIFRLTYGTIEEKREALKMICDLDRTDLVDNVVDLVDRSDGRMFMDFLRTLRCLGALEQDLVIEFLNNIDFYFTEEYSYPNENRNKKIIANYLLLTLDNTDGVPYLIETLNSMSNEIGTPELKALDLMLVKTPYLAEEIRVILIAAVNSSTYYRDRGAALYLLYRHFGSSVANFIIESLNNSNYVIRMQAADLLIEMNHPEANLILRDKLYNDDFPECRRYLATLLLEKFANPTDLKFVIDYLPFEPDLLASDIIEMRISDFKPIRYQTKEVLVGKLIYYINEITTLGWLTEERRHDYLIYTDILNQLEYGEEFCNNMTQFYYEVENDHGHALTEEGYKFVHYTLQYINKELEGAGFSCL